MSASPRMTPIREMPHEATQKEFAKLESLLYPTLESAVTLAS